DRPVFTGAVDRFALEIAMAEPPGDRVPGHRLAAHAPAAFGFETLDAGPHGGNVAIGEIEGHRVRVERSARVDFRPAFDDSDIDSLPRQVRRERAAGRPRAHHAHIVDFLGHASTL